MKAGIASAMDEEGRLHIGQTQGLQRFTRPVLLLTCECNILIGIDHQTQQQRYFPNSQLKLISQNGHMMFSEQSAATLEAIREHPEGSP